MRSESASKIAERLRAQAEVYPQIASLLREAAERLAIAQAAETFLDACEALRRVKSREPANLPDSPPRSSSEAVAHQQHSSPAVERPYWLKDDDR
jgi:hypothetical protein